MRIKVIEAEVYSKLDLANLPYGEYPGVWGGYEVNVVIHGNNCRMQTADGIRTPHCECVVKVSREGVTVEDTD